MTFSLSQRLEKYLKQQAIWISSGELQRIVAEKTDYSPANCTRRLRELQEEGILQVKYIKGHAWYRYGPKYWTTAESVQFFDSYENKEPSRS